MQGPTRDLNDYDICIYRTAISYFLLPEMKERYWPKKIIHLEKGAQQKDRELYAFGEIILFTELVGGG